MSYQFNEFHDAADRERLTRIAEARTSDDLVVDDILQATIGETAETKSRIVRGESNEVYAVKLQSGQEVILRIGHKEGDKLAQEAWAINEAKNIGVPVPTILTVGDYGAGERAIHYSIQEKLHGTPFDALLWVNGIAPERAKAITEEAGEILAKIHSIKTTGWGRITAPFTGSYPTLDGRVTHLEEAAEKIDKSLKAVDVAGLPSADALIRRLSEGYKILEGHQTLIHGDFGPKHLFIDEDDHIVGVIDWEDLESNDPAQELARWNFWFEESVPVAWLKEGHERISGLGDDYDERFRVTKMDNLTWSLLYHTFEEPSEKWAYESARALKELFSRKVN